MPSFVNTLRRCHSTVRGLRNSWVLISGFERPSRASRAIWALLRGELDGRLDGAFAHGLPGGQQLAAGALGEPLSPIATSISWAVRSCLRASTRRFSRRSHSP